MRSAADRRALLDLERLEEVNASQQGLTRRRGGTADDDGVQVVVPGAADVFEDDPHPVTSGKTTATLCVHTPSGNADLFASRSLWDRIYDPPAWTPMKKTKKMRLSDISPSKRFATQDGDWIFLKTKNMTNDFQARASCKSPTTFSSSAGSADSPVSIGYPDAFSFLMPTSPNNSEPTVSQQRDNNVVDVSDDD